MPAGEELYAILDEDGAFADATFFTDPVIAWSVAAPFFDEPLIGVMQLQYPAELLRWWDGADAFDDAYGGRDGDIDAETGVPYSDNAVENLCIDMPSVVGAILYTEPMDAQLFDEVLFCNPVEAAVLVDYVDVMSPEPLMQRAVRTIEEVLSVSPAVTGGMYAYIANETTNPTEPRYQALAARMAADDTLQAAYAASPANSTGERPEETLERFVSAANRPWPQVSGKRRIR